MSRIAAEPCRTLATSIVLLALLPAVAAGQTLQSSADVDAPAGAAAVAPARDPAVKVSGLLVWAWRALSPDRADAAAVSVSRFAPTAAHVADMVEPATSLHFDMELAADRGRLHHGGNLFRVDF